MEIGKLVHRSDNKYSENQVGECRLRSWLRVLDTALTINIAAILEGFTQHCT